MAISGDGKRELQPGQTPRQQVRYPHMLPADCQTWTRALRRFGDHFQKLWYDVHVGQAVEPPEGSPAFLVAVAQGVTRKRIDVVIFSGALYYVAEVKPFGSAVAVGQALLYRQLFEQEFDLEFGCLATVICDVWDPDASAVAEAMGVKVLETGYKAAGPVFAAEA